jgi:hypothetical protein
MDEDKERERELEEQRQAEEEEEQDQISPKKAIWAILFFVISIVIGYLALGVFDYIDQSNHRRSVKAHIDKIAFNLKSNQPIQATVLEGLEFDLDQLKSELSDDNALKKEYSEIKARMDSYPVYVARGIKTVSWANSQIVYTEMDTIVVPYKDRIKYSIKTITTPVTVIDKRASQLLQSHPDWSKDDCIRIAKGDIWIGMRKDQLQLSRGTPHSVDKSYNGNILNEQWAYGKLGPFVYLENGIVVSWQE